MVDFLSFEIRLLTYFRNTVFLLSESHLQYKKQQREIQFQFKRAGINVTEDRILTIDQCQGQEADTVLLSLVQKPTKFLNKNRFNVALSRTRNELFIVGDRNEFASASRNRDWECSYLAQDILLSI